MPLPHAPHSGASSSSLFFLSVRNHTRAIHVFDRGGKLRLLMNSGRTVDQMAADLALLLKE